MLAASFNTSASTGRPRGAGRCALRLVAGPEIFPGPRPCCRFEAHVLTGLALWLIGKTIVPA